MSIKLTIPSLALMAGLLVTGFDAAQPAQAQWGPPAPWCVRAYDGGTECFYLSLAQCRAAASGTGGDCAVNPRYMGDPNQPGPRPRRGYR
jgi:hypothetical protein